MNFFEKYNIRYKGLRTGHHNLNFELEDSFFRNFDDPECRGGSIRIEAELEKKDDLLTFVFTFSQSVKVVCDRCLEEFDLPLNFKTTLYVRFDEEGPQEDPEVLHLDPKENKICLARYFMESIRLNLPIKRTHPLDKNGESLCNMEMLRKLEQHLFKENKENRDPRWDSLRDLLG